MMYGAGTEVVLPDRTLAHLQVVVAAKLRRREAFFLSWANNGGADGHSKVWIGVGIPLMFRFDSARHGPLNPRWIELLQLSANSQAGLFLMAEPEEVSPGPHHRLTDEA